MPSEGISNAASSSSTGGVSGSDMRRNRGVSPSVAETPNQASNVGNDGRDGSDG